EIRTMTEQGKIGFPQVMQAFENMTAAGGKFSGMMKAQSSTWNGLLSTFRDNLGQALIAFGTPIIDGLTPILEGWAQNGAGLNSMLREAMRRSRIFYSQGLEKAASAKSIKKSTRFKKQ
ncbi:MAG: hypothetical protein ACK5LK_01040, partial [Chthoniobacterales bacterium]